MNRQSNFSGSHGSLSWGVLLDGLREGSPSAYVAVAALVTLAWVAIWAGRNMMKMS